MTNTSSQQQGEYKMKNVIFIITMFMSTGCYDESDPESDSDMNSDSDTNSNTESDSASESVSNDCMYKEEGYSAGSCRCDDQPTSLDHYACCEESTGGKFGWKWYLCPVGPMNSKGTCTYNAENISISCTYPLN
jgi:hypothetical protein